MIDEFLARWRAHQCTWMDRPDEWLWQAPGGVLQGFGLNWRQSPGLANLLWLATDLYRPPKLYDARGNQLYVLLLVNAPTMTLNGIDLIDQAGSLTLQQFRRECANGDLKGPNQLVKHFPVVQLLLNRRCQDAHA